MLNSFQKWRSIPEGQNLAELQKGNAFEVGIF
jgi:hypothetical protein